MNTFQKCNNKNGPPLHTHAMLLIYTNMDMYTSTSHSFQLDNTNFKEYIKSPVMP